MLKPLYEILFYLKANPQHAQLAKKIEDELISTLTELNENCLEYIRITTQLFQQECNGKSIFEQLLTAEMHRPLFKVMMIDGPFRYEFARIYLQLRDKGYSLRNF